MSNRVKTNLSKSLYMRGCQCPKALWLNKYHPELKQPISPNREALFAEGHAIGKFAQALFPNGFPIDQNAETIPHRLKLTQTRILAGDETIYEATFQEQNLLIMADILHCTPQGWSLYEVKSSTHEKPHLLHDVALQFYIIQKKLPNLNKAHLILINPNYEREGDLDINKLFQFIDVTQKIKPLLAKIESKITEFKQILQWPFEPTIEIGSYCTIPYSCEFIPYCWKHLPEPSIFNITGLHHEQKMALYQDGLHHISQIPDTFELTPKQQIQVSCEKEDKMHIQIDQIKNFLSTISYPLYFLDFEAFQMAIPPFERLKPYQQVAFQYSLHIQEKPSGPLKHKAFLAMPDQDPRESMALSLTHDIPDNACIITYSAGYERLVFKQLAHDFPEFSKKLLHLQSKIVDLMTPFEKNYIYTKKMQGSHSIKTVLPALVPELKYEGLQIKDGQSAALAYQRMQKTEEWSQQLEIKNNLLEYCKLDTLAMVKLLEKLKEVVHSQSIHKI